MKHLSPIHASILPCGTVNLRNGNMPMFGCSTMDMWTNCWLHLYIVNNKPMLVASSGETVSESYDKRDFHHDQTLRFIGHGEFYKTYPNTLEGLRDVRLTMNTTKCKVATFK